MFPSRRIATMSGDVFRNEYSLAFDGSNDYLDCGGFHVGTSDFTIAMWVKFPQNAGGNRDNTYNYLMGSWTNEENYWYLRIDGNSKFHFFDRIGDANVIHHIGSATIGLDAWYHLVFTRDRNTPLTQMYVNGTFDSTDNNSDSSVASLEFDSFAINRGAANFTSYGEGSSEENYYSDVTVYNKALSASEVATIYNGREPYNHKEGIASGNLQAWWRMGDGRLDGFDSSGDATYNTGLITDESAATYIGPELLLNGDFATDKHWSLGSGWSIDTGSGVVTRASGESGNSRILYSGSDAVTAGNVYKYSFDYNVTSGTFSAYLGGVTIDNSFNGSGTTSGYVLATNGVELNIYGLTSAEGTIDNCSVKLVTGGNPGVMINMAAENFIGDTP